MALLDAENTKRMTDIYNSMRDWSGNCLDKKMCGNVCCTEHFITTYVEFTYLWDGLMRKSSEEDILQLFAAPRRPVKSQILVIGLDPGEHPNYCPLSTAEGCRAYEARPYICRAYVYPGRDGRGKNSERNMYDPRLNCRPECKSLYGVCPENREAARAIVRLNESLPIGKELKGEASDIFYWIRTLILPTRAKA